ncbi:MAG: diguanylate cyclase and metal-dependent phosphohydrolase [Solirubrobacterales bacterium]|nr:diguanylate cyclase and metal-dependent phosphohydrolase [Solirubrobacterales bacterium]
MTMSSMADEPRASSDAHASLQTSFDSRLMAKALAGLFAAGATLALVTAALPHSPRASDAGLLVIVGIAYVVGGVLHWRASTVPSWSLRAALALGSTLITGVAYFSAQTPSPLVFFYLWVFLYSAYFFTTVEMVAQIAYVGIAYGALLVARPPSDGVPEWWLVGMGTLFVAAMLIRSMRERVELLIARLYDAARADPLTKLPNRRGFRELLDLELERARRADGQVALLVADIDHFKQVNDRSGHGVGDAALQRVARTLEGGKRTIDGLARVGGGQFAMVLPDTDPHSAFATAERLRCELREEFARDTVPVTASFGVAGFGSDGETAASLLRAADEALFAAKTNGRDRTVIYSRLLPSAAHADRQSRDIEGERFIAVILDLAEAVDLRFSGSARHSETVGRYAEMMARELGLSERRVARVELAGRLHDIGKVGVPDSILSKPAKLTDEEFTIVRQHPDLGAQILEHASLVDVREWVRAHHERPDGRGYPLGLPGEAIALEARILAVADAYEAMTSDRAYRQSIGHRAAAEELEACAGAQFDPRVVDALLTVLRRDAEHAEASLARL